MPRRKPPVRKPPAKQESSKPGLLTLTDLQTVFNQRRIPFNTTLLQRLIEQNKITPAFVQSGVVQRVYFSPEQLSHIVEAVQHAHAQFAPTHSLHPTPVPAIPPAPSPAPPAAAPTPHPKKFLTPREFIAQEAHRHPQINLVYLMEQLNRGRIKPDSSGARFKERYLIDPNKIDYWIQAATRVKKRAGRPPGRKNKPKTASLPQTPPPMPHRPMPPKAPAPTPPKNPANWPKGFSIQSAPSKTQPRQGQPYRLQWISKPLSKPRQAPALTTTNPTAKQPKENKPMPTAPIEPAWFKQLRSNAPFSVVQLRLQQVALSRETHLAVPRVAHLLGISIEQVRDLCSKRIIELDTTDPERRITLASIHNWFERKGGRP